MGYETFHTMIALLLVAALLFPTRSEECEDRRNYASRLIIDSRRNDTGRWVSQVELVHSDTGEDQGEPWTVDVHQRTSNCGDDSDGDGHEAKENGFVVVGATLVSPRVSGQAAAAAAQETPHVHMTPITSTGLWLSHTPLPWEEARRVCAVRGGHLEGLAEANLMYMKIYLGWSNVEMAYVDLRRSAAANHEFVFSSGQPLGTSHKVKWAPGSPATTGPLSESACAALSGGMLQDVSCDTRLIFFCDGIA